MPSRRNIKPPSKFSFVTLEFEAKDMRWVKIHSGAARSHAAYWGGSAKYQGPSREECARQQDNTAPSISVTDKDSSPRNGGSSCFAVPPVRRRRSIKPKSAKAIGLLPNAGSEFLRHIEPDNLRYLPSVPSEIRATGSPAATCLSIFEFCGESFVKQYVMLDHEDYSIMFNGCQLLSYAHSMALTGHGSKTVLLELKSQVIRRISAKIKSSDGVLSPRYLTAILALGAPIVCLVSQDLPKSLSIREYINASMQDDSLCCQESANSAQRALDEQIVHRQAIHRLFLKSNDSFQDTDSLALLRYISNCVNISMAIEAAHPGKTSSVDGGDFPPTGPCENCFFPAHWTSPLTCLWLNKTSTTHAETKILLLARLMHRWLATFLDGDSHPLVPTKELLEERAKLRERLECFLPVGRTSTTEAEAMYECCRWASLILLAVEKLRVPIRVAATIVRIQPRLIRRLRMTDLPNLWGIHRGLLFWVAAVCHFATVDRCFPLLCTALLARFAQEIVMLDCCSEIAIKPLRRLKQFESSCCCLETTCRDYLSSY